MKIVIGGPFSGKQQDVLHSVNIVFFNLVLTFANQHLITLQVAPYCGDAKHTCIYNPQTEEINSSLWPVARSNTLLVRWNYLAVIVKQNKPSTAILFITLLSKNIQFLSVYKSFLTSLALSFYVFCNQTSPVLVPGSCFQ